MLQLPLIAFRPLLLQLLSCPLPFLLTIQQLGQPFGALCEGQLMTSSGVILPDSRPAMSIIGLRVEPGGYCLLIARLIIGFTGSLARVL